MPWWMEQIVLTTVLWTAVGTAACTFLVGRRRVRDIEDVQIVLQTMDRDITLYQAAAFIGESPIEVTVWLLLERGCVHVSRDGQIRAAVNSKPELLHDPAQAAVHRLLLRNPQGMRLTEIKDDSTCSRLCITDQQLENEIPELAELDGTDALRWWSRAASFLLPTAAGLTALVLPFDYKPGAVAYWMLVTVLGVIVLLVITSNLFPRTRAMTAQAPLELHCRQLLAERFVELGYDEERLAIHRDAYRHADIHARTRSGSTPSSTPSGCGTDGSYSFESSDHSSCGGSSCGGSCSSGGGGSSCGGGCGS